MSAVRRQLAELMGEIGFLDPHSKIKTARDMENAQTAVDDGVVFALPAAQRVGRVEGTVRACLVAALWPNGLSLSPFIFLSLSLSPSLPPSPSLSPSLPLPSSSSLSPLQDRSAARTKKSSAEGGSSRRQAQDSHFPVEGRRRPCSPSFFAGTSPFSPSMHED